jgi:hypothetical protein
VCYALGGLNHPSYKMLNPDQRRWQADKLGDLATYTISALLIGQIVAQEFRTDMTIIGLVLSFSLYLYSNILLKKVK